MVAADARVREGAGLERRHLRVTVCQLDQAVLAWIAEGDRAAAVPPDATLAETRAGYRRACRHFAAPRPDGLATDDRVLAGVPCRIYRPARAGGSCILWFHGGGWVLGDLDTHDSLVADLADAAGCVAIAVDYRLAPEHPFPAAFEDALAVFRQLRDASPLPGVDRILVAGDSAGGNLAATVAQACRDLGEPGPAGQLLVYPALSADMELRSRIEMAQAPGLSMADMRHFLETYLGRVPGPVDLADARLFPGDAADLSGLPPAFLTGAEYDPLASDVLAHAARLRGAGVSVEAVIEAGLPHAWLRARHHAPPAAAAFARLVGAARRMAGPPGDAASSELPPHPL
jgi:acetyl esterase